MALKKRKWFNRQSYVSDQKGGLVSFLFFFFFVLFFTFTYSYWLKTQEEDAMTDECFKEMCENNN